MDIILDFWNKLSYFHIIFFSIILVIFLYISICCIRKLLKNDMDHIVISVPWDYRFLSIIFLLHILGIPCLFMPIFSLPLRIFLSSTIINHYITSMIIYEIVTVSYIFCVIMYIKKNFPLFQWKILGIKNFPCWDILKKIIAYLCFFPWVIASLLLSILVVTIFNYTPEEQDIAKYVRNSSGIIFYIVVFIVLVLAPLTEEFLFRVIMYSTIKKYFTVWQSIFISGVIFALLHFNIFAFFPILTLGMFLSYVYEKSQNYITNCCIHSFHNLLALCYVLYVG